MFRIAACLALALSTSACLTESQFQTMVTDAATCTPADTCAVAGPPTNGCTCFQVVRSSEVANIEAAARQVACGGKMAKCAMWVNPRCEGGVCVGDRP